MSTQSAKHLVVAIARKCRTVNRRSYNWKHCFGLLALIVLLFAFHLRARCKQRVLAVDLGIEVNREWTLHHGPSMQEIVLDQEIRASISDLLSELLVERPLRWCEWNRSPLVGHFTIRWGQGCHLSVSPEGVSLAGLVGDRYAYDDGDDLARRLHATIVETAQQSPGH